jgi:TctA family transporter
MLLYYDPYALLYLGFWGIFVIGYYAVAIILCIWVYKDAEKRGLNGGLWLLIIILTGLIGFIIYMVIARRGNNLFEPEYNGRK